MRQRIDNGIADRRRGTKRGRFHRRHDEPCRWQAGAARHSTATPWERLDTSDDADLAWAWIEARLFEDKQDKAA